MFTQPRLEILICTLDEGIDDVITHMLTPPEGVWVTISHQITHAKYQVSRSWPTHVAYHPLEGRGVAKNRNNALRWARGEICIMSDDDIEYVPEAFDIITQAYRDHPTATVITFQAENQERWKKSFTHTWRTVGQVSEWMITFHRQRVHELGIVFDEEFGLGAIYPQGEGNIFLSDLRRAGALVIAHPAVIIRHPDTSSGYIFTPERITAKIMAARRMYGWWAGLATLVVFAVTKHPYYHPQGISWW